MIVNGKGRPTDKVRNLRRFAEQWREFEDIEAPELDDGDAEYVAGALHLDGCGLDRYHELADALEVL